MTQDEFRAAMNAAKKAGGMLWVTNGSVSGIALGYDSGTNEAVLFKDERVPLDGLREMNPFEQVEGDQTNG